MTDISKPQKIPRLSRNFTNTERWQAIATRDITANSFVYAVLTTKIYCRPSCPARLARRANVQFYDTPLQAEKAGFRPCKRCRPDSGQTAAQSNPQTAVIDKACESIRNILTTGLKPKLRDLAAEAGLTSSHFHRVFKKHVGVTPLQYAESLMQSNLHSPESSPSDDFSGIETPRSASRDRGGEVLDLDRNSEKGAGLSAARETIPFLSGWNEFDALLASELEQTWVPGLSIDPRRIFG
ncbi:Ada DNA repair, metal-binding [Penicillium expansum]|uniref:Ada DNA repair, metal-binding n=1 Tax=Penicillium expansum TaxID=27334 RepID=A0A0A2JL19_PENEN|nr:Ada DNA repair, metal-binding [Penicillium expansum]KGO45502.1 Ada DNA repair, metal-binding [Penicillium expansum]KGO56087.1 Ada DNA repair, metal-binding [Penicillium expansum]KGO57267.1 Ada DNA repair, metal-binding [Penicillium expansum]